jgi:hypothetical protein
MYTIAVGNAFDGLRFYGIHGDFDSAERDAFDRFDGLEWWIVEIN